MEVERYHSGGCLSPAAGRYAVHRHAARSALGPRALIALGPRFGTGSFGASQFLFGRFGLALAAAEHGFALGQPLTAALELGLALHQLAAQRGQDLLRFLRARLAALQLSARGVARIAPLARELADLTLSASFHFLAFFAGSFSIGVDRIREPAIFGL